jgi:hypothetical protein
MPTVISVNSMEELQPVLASFQSGELQNLGIFSVVLGLFPRVDSTTEALELEVGLEGDVGAMPLVKESEDGLQHDTADKESGTRSQPLVSNQTQ